MKGRPSEGRRRRAIRLGAAAFLFSGALLLLPGSLARHVHASAPLPGLRAAGGRDRVLVFAPHPDDETLGAGGLIYEAAHRGADVRIVFLTNGDAFPVAAAVRERTWPAPGVMRRFARHRQAEATRAASALGVPSDRLTFLGYPDRGLAALWADHWSVPYTSPSTHLSRAASGRPYSGGSLLREVEALLRTVRPTVVYYPSPADDHPDHCTGHAFVRLALERLGSPAVARTYLVHRGAWPDRSRRKPLSPPDELALLDASWQRCDLAPEAVSAKRAALAAYRSQTAVSGGFLRRFLRADELLADWRRVDAGEGAAFLPDAIRDRWARTRLPAVDLTGVEVRPDEQGLALTLRTRGGVTRNAEYRISWKPVEGAERELVTRTYRLAGRSAFPRGVASYLGGSEWTVEVSREELRGCRSVMVGGEVWAGPVLLDRMPCRVVRLTPGAG